MTWLPQSVESVATRQWVFLAWTFSFNRLSTHAMLKSDIDMFCKFTNFYTLPYFMAVQTGYFHQAHNVLTFLQWGVHLGLRVYYMYISPLQGTFKVVIAISGKGLSIVEGNSLSNFTFFVCSVIHYQILISLFILLNICLPFSLSCLRSWLLILTL